MKRAVLLVAGLIIGGVAAMSCGGPSAAPSTSTTSTTYVGSALSWVSTKARPWNKKLNDDQALVDSASVSSSEIGKSVFFGRLASACTRLLGDARRAQQVQPAPSAALATAWQGMATRTEAYASACLTLTRNRTNAAFTRWNDSLNAMNSANATLNAQVAVLRGTTGTPAG